MDHTPENLEHLSNKEQEQQDEVFTPRPISQNILAWVLIAVVLFGFLGTCYWMVKF